MHCRHHALLRSSVQPALELVQHRRFGQSLSAECSACGEEVWITYHADHLGSFSVAAVRRQGRGLELINPIFYTAHQLLELEEIAPGSTAG